MARPKRTAVAKPVAKVVSNGSETAAKKRKSTTPSKKAGGKSKGRAPSKTPAKKSKADETSYDVEEVRGISKSKSGEVKVLIKWAGYAEKENSWEPIAQVSCSDLVKKFLTNSVKEFVKDDVKDDEEEEETA